MRLEQSLKNPLENIKQQLAVMSSGSEKDSD